jgi:hypothetical protein
MLERQENQRLRNEGLCHEIGQQRCNFGAKLIILLRIILWHEMRSSHHGLKERPNEDLNSEVFMARLMTA